MRRTLISATALVILIFGLRACQDTSTSNLSSAADRGDSQRLAVPIGSGDPPRGILAPALPATPDSSDNSLTANAALKQFLTRQTTSSNAVNKRDFPGALLESLF